MHFFIDHTKLKNQSDTGDGFGPSSAEPLDKYEVSANFDLDGDAKAFACQQGHVVVTEYFDVAAGVVDPERVNVILKPTAGLVIDFPKIKYYVYRGIRRDSFFTGDAFNAEDAAGNADTVRKMWEDWHKNIATSPTALAPSDVGFDPALDEETQIEEIFGHHLMTSAGALIRTREVAEGEWIGMFFSGKKICFEVIVEAELLELTLMYAKKSKAQIDIGAMPAATPEEIHARRCEQEKILAFVDPAALFGMHFSLGVSASGLAKAAKGDTLATTLLSPFSTATRVYIDIRSEKGYSYNFYGNYGGGGASPNLIQIRPGSAAAADDVYLHQGWPLFSQSGWTGPGVKVNLGLRLRIDDNIKPLLFVEDTGHLGAGSKNFLDPAKLLDGAALDWSREIQLKLDGSGAAGAKICVATHVRLQYLKLRTGVEANPRLLEFKHRLDTVFGGIDLPIGAVSKLRELQNDKAGLSAGPGFAHMPQTGMYFDPEVVMLYGSSKVAYRTNKHTYPTTDFTISTLDNVVRSPVFPSDIVFSRWSVVEGGASIGLIDLSFYKKGTKDTNIDGIHFLGLKRDELIQLQEIEGFGPVHQRYLVFEEAAEQVDDSGFPYKKFEVKVQGLNPAGDRLVLPADPAIHVFGAGANMFCSSGFTSSVSLPEVPPDPGMMKQWEHVFSGIYLFGDPEVEAVSPGGRITVNDVGNDLGENSPTVRLRGRYFFPTDCAEATSISERKTSYPLVVIVNGNGHLYTDYDALARRLAHNGFIVAIVNLMIAFVDSAKLKHRPGTTKFIHSVRGVIVIEYDHGTQKVVVYTGPDPIPQSWVSGKDFKIDLVSGVPDAITFLRSAPPDVKGLAPHGRAEVLFKHLQIIKEKFGEKVADNIGLIGHSRGGEAVVRAADFIGASSAPATLRIIKAIISLSPTDRSEKESLTKDIPYFVMYGSMDGDASGKRGMRQLGPGRPSMPAGTGGFSLYDRAKNAAVDPTTRVKSMAFVYGANHNGFITSNDRREEKKQLPGSSEWVNISTLETRTQQAIARAYMNAFLRQHLLGEPIWKSYFTGEFIPGSIGYEKIYLQYKEMVPGRFHVVDDFEDTAHDWTRSSSGQTVSHSREGVGLAEGLLNPYPPSLDVDSPHETQALKVTGWKGGDTLTFTVATGGLDVKAAWTHLSFRIAQVANRTNSPIATMQVAIVDTSSRSHPVGLSRPVPDPDNRPDDSGLTKSAFLTVRIPLADYEAHVDLTKVQSVKFLFPTEKNATGNIELDDVEFTK